MRRNDGLIKLLKLICILMILYPVTYLGIISNDFTFGHLMVFLFRTAVCMFGVRIWMILNDQMIVKDRIKEEWKRFKEDDRF